MAESFEHILIVFFKNFRKRLILLRNPDGFLDRPDIKSYLENQKILILRNSGLEYRLHLEIEMRKPGYSFSKTCFLVSSQEDVLEDIQMESDYGEFLLEKYLPEYHQSTILSCSLPELHELFRRKPLRTLTREGTEQYIREIREYISPNQQSEKKKEDDITALQKILGNSIRWEEMVRPISQIILDSLLFDYFNSIKPILDQLNEEFQIYLEKTYHSQIKPFSYIKRPRIVSHILNHIQYHYNPTDKIALCVIDGMAYWQYIMLSKHLNDCEIEEKTVYAWLPSITQLSRQAIFRGKEPMRGYRQNPTNEGKLWKEFWQQNGIHSANVKYLHGNLPEENFQHITRLAWVENILDDKMHGAVDYRDLKSTTENWIKHGQIIQNIHHLLDIGFTIFLTSDHGNIQATNWRNLNSKEKLGTNQSGSRSKRHIEYADKETADRFIENNPELISSVIQENKAIYFKNDYSFSNKESLVTHGGSHLLEVLVPFVKISHG